MDVSQIRESISNQARVKREKQNFFRSSVGDLTKLQRTAWKNYVKVNGLGLASIKTSALGTLIKTTGLPRRYRGNIIFSAFILCATFSYLHSLYKGEIWQLLSGSLYKEHLWPLEYRNITKESKDAITLATEEIGRVG